MITWAGQRGEAETQIPNEGGFKEPQTWGRCGGQGGGCWQRVAIEAGRAVGEEF